MNCGQRRHRGELIRSAIFFLAFCSCAHRLSGQAGFWSGVLKSGELTWDIGLEIKPDGAARFFSAALWRADVEAEQYARNGSDVSFKIPFDIGVFAGSISDDAIAGKVLFATGETQPLTLTRKRQEKLRVEELEFSNGDVKIAASLYLPAKHGKYPSVVILHGGGNSSRESAPYAFWADYLARRGYACLVYDKRGNGASTGDWRTVGFQERATDVISGLNGLAGHPEIDAEKMGLIAVSQGTWVAGLVAKNYPALSFLVNIVGPLVPPLEADTYALEYSLRNSNWRLDEIKERVGLWKMLADFIREPQQGREWEALQSAIERVKDREWFQRNPYAPSRSGWFVGWYAQVLDHDPYPILEQIDQPILWVYGNRDSQSDFAKNLAQIYRLQKKGKPHEIAVFDKTGHGMLSPVEEYGAYGPLVATPDGFFEAIEEWLRARTK